MVLSFIFDGSFAFLFFIYIYIKFLTMARLKSWEKFINWAITVATAVASCYNLINCGQMFN